MPRRQGQGGGSRATQAAAGYQQIHRFAFVQQLMRKGYMLESAALDTFAQLTGHRTGEQQRRQLVMGRLISQCNRKGYIA
jgi:hypothetical protein